MPEENKAHVWRMCGIGRHWVNRHGRRVRKSRQHPKGYTIVNGHCRSNPSKKDQLYLAEIQAIVEKYFKTLDKKFLPTNNNLGYAKGNEFDQLIAGWTKYWNDIFKPKIKLDPNLVKALIATESSFIPESTLKRGNQDNPHGLMQLLKSTIDILKDEKGELKDFLINLNYNNAYIAELNICAGIRWLFHKKNLLEARRKKEAPWSDVVIEYKSYWKALTKKDPDAIGQINKFNGFYEKLKKGK